jgi:protoporphyrinogen oxidase
MKKRIVIVGGGIIGCITAIHLVKAGHLVTILEQKNKLGGVLNDQKINKNIFYSGTQYFDANEYWFEVLKSLVPEFKIFDFNYGSFTNLDSNKIISDKIPLPIFDFNLNKIKKKMLIMSHLSMIGLKFIQKVSMRS